MAVNICDIASGVYKASYTNFLNVYIVCKIKVVSNLIPSSKWLIKYKSVVCYKDVTAHNARSGRLLLQHCNKELSYTHKESTVNDFQTIPKKNCPFLNLTLTQA
jgi:hypothetical protein